MAKDLVQLAIIRRGSDHPAAFQLRPRYHRVVSDRSLGCYCWSFRCSTREGTLRGYAVDAQGQRVPFQRRCSYDFKTQEWQWFPLTA